MDDDEEKSARWVPVFGLLVTVAAVIVPFAIVREFDLDKPQEAWFLVRAFGVSSALLAASGSIVGMCAHNRSKQAELIGKILGLNAAVLALWLSGLALIAV